MTPPVRTRPVAELLADDEARIVSANEAAAQLLEYSPEQLLSLHVWDLTPSAQAEGALDLWRRFLQDGSQSGMFDIVTGRGRVVTVDYSATANHEPGRHLSLLRPVSAPRASARPGDECPFPRPFAAGFRDCSAFLPRVEPAADSLGHPIHSVVTCCHLRPATSGRNRFYAACAIGNPVLRNAWTREVEAKGLGQVIELRRLFAIELEPALRAAFQGRRGKDRGPELLKERVAGFVSRHEESIRSAGIDPSEMTRTLSAAMDRQASGVEAAGWFSAAELGRMPLGLRVFLRPESAHLARA